MRSHTTREFRQALQVLPEHIRRQAREAYSRFEEDPFHPSLRFRRVHPARPIFSVRITADYRALGVREGDDVVWFWVGTHGDYEQMLARR